MPRSRNRRSDEAPANSSESQVERKWIWFRPEIGGRSRSQEEFDDLPAAGRGRLLAVVKRHIAGESRRKDIDHLGSGIYELRTRVGNDHYRVLFANWGPHWVALTAFYKNQQTTPKQDLDRAKDRRDRWEARFGKTPR
ncbi:type II toxin-antitoxin system RelE/ParE family toxin [Micromonospora radicis]|uniref:type II toxin-antitoxin system RelE/ParE family toxin n=1 Tax=Micromonospora radicis TaxID=1894971 RepID=UPI00131471A2|nr:type II toxin-antitoxin system RelE/ParE family toxin [Micromonospora radicis]